VQFLVRPHKIVTVRLMILADYHGVVMTSRTIAYICALALVSACSEGPTQSDGRTTETFTLTTTRLGPSGGMQYPAGTAVPSFTVSETGLVEASVSITPVLDCEFVLAIDPTTSSGNAVLKTRGRAQMLSVQGELMPGSYFVGVTAREGGMSLCNGLPEESLLFPHTIVVTHP
jgi:hypothetical protein